MVKIAVMGHGVVGSGVVEVICKNRENISSSAGCEIKVVKILDLRDFGEVSYSYLFTKNFEDILNDGEISIVVECIGGLSPSYEYSLALLKSGKSVVSSNKELVSQKGQELLAIAKENGVNYLFEASVGGGVPIVKPIYSCLAANRIESIQGILNGTTNFIMTKMFKDGLSFVGAVELAKKLGYAEKDPSDDVNGIDSKRKICILASLVCGERICSNNIYTNGIASVGIEDVLYAQSVGCVIKLIGSFKALENGKVFVMVCPAFISVSNGLASIDDVFNAIVVRGNAVGEVMFVGAGAGKFPTASAIISDIIDIVKAEGKTISPHWKKEESLEVLDYRESSSKFYLRFSVLNRKEAEEFIFNNYSFPVILSRLESPETEIAFKTGLMNEGLVEELEKKAEASGFRQVSKLRIID